jgi:uncharacterized protein YbjQ (UPF0145 family)
MLVTGGETIPGQTITSVIGQVAADARVQVSAHGLQSLPAIPPAVRANACRQPLEDGRGEALAALAQKAVEMGASGIICFRMAYAGIGQDLLVTVYGTAVCTERGMMPGRHPVAGDDP